MIRSKIAMGFLWVLFALALHVWPMVPRARAQGSRKDDIVFNSRGVPLAGATVRVCVMPASGQPCTPLAQIFSDAALTQALANPTTTDGLGNYFFYAAPGKYEIEFSGPAITTKQIPNVILPSDPTSPNFSSVSSSGGISAFSLNLTGNLTVNGNTTVVGNLASGTLNLANQSTAPGAAGTGTVNLYTKTADKRLYYKDDTGTEIGPIANTTGAQTNVTNTFTAPQNFAAGGSLAGSFSGGPAATIANSPTGATESGNAVTITTTATCTFVTGQAVNVSGVGVAGYNGNFLVLSPGCNGTSTFTYTNSTASLAASGGGTATGSPILSGNLTVTGAATAAQLNGCQDVNASQSFAAALAAAGTSGCIQITPGTYTVSANATIPVGVALGISGGGGLSIANTITLVINGPIQAPSAQIFSGTGTINLGPVPSSNMNVLWWWAGGEIGQAFATTYASSDSGGGFAWLPTAPGGGCYTWTTTLAETTVGKAVRFKGTVPPNQLNSSTIRGTCVNWTSTSAGQAATIDYTPNTGGGASPTELFSDMTITNNLCNTNFGCSSSANGFLFGGTNSGAQSGYFQNLRMEGFANAWAFTGNASWGMRCINCTFIFNTNGPNVSNAEENITFIDSVSELNGTNLLVGNGAEVTWDGGSIDGAGTCGAALSGNGILRTKGTHWENQGISNSHQICNGGAPSTKWFPSGDFLLDDNNTGSGDYVFRAGDMMGSIAIFSSGKTFSSFFTVDNAALLNVDNISSGVLTGNLGLGGSGYCMIGSNSGLPPTCQMSHLQSTDGVGSSFRPTCAFTSGGGTSPACLVDAGSSDSMGVIQLQAGTGSPAASGSMTLTFSGAFRSQNSFVRCQWAPSQGLAGQWNARASILDKTTSTSSSLANWDNNAIALSVSTTYEATYRCVGQ